MSALAKLNRPVVAVLAVGLIAGYLRFVHLGYPERRVFDEYYYPKSACIYLGYSNERCDINSADERYWRENENDTGSWVHPPLGKWMIALGELGFGTESFGWRVASAASGTATVVLLAVIVQLLFASPIWTFAGGLLLATENLNVVQSRTATLDILVTFWIVLGFLFLLLDRRWIERRMPDPPEASEVRRPGARGTPERAGAPLASVPVRGGTRPRGGHRDEVVGDHRDRDRDRPRPPVGGDATPARRHAVPDRATRSRPRGSASSSSC